MNISLNALWLKKYHSGIRSVADMVDNDRQKSIGTTVAFCIQMFECQSR